MISSTKGEKTYVGSTTDMKKRIKEHKNRNKCSSYKLKEEYGWDNLQFTVLEECANDARREREQHWMNVTPNTVNDRRVVPDPIIDRKKRLERRRQYNEANKEKRLEYQRQYNEANKEKRLEYQRQYNEANKEKILEYREANKEKILEYHRQYREQHKLEKDK